METLLFEVHTVSCPKCNSESVSTIPAEIRLYRNGPRTLSHPPMYPSPDIKICLDCGWSEFTVPDSFRTAWLKPQPVRVEPQPVSPSIAQKQSAVAAQKSSLRPMPVAV